MRSELPFRIAILFATASGLTAGAITLLSPAFLATLVAAAVTLGYLSWAALLRAGRARAPADYALALPLALALAGWAHVSPASHTPAVVSALALPAVALGAFAPLEGVVVQGVGILVTLAAIVALSSSDSSALLVPAATTAAAVLLGGLLSLGVERRPTEQRRSPLGRALFRALPIGLLLVEDGRIVRANPVMGSLVLRDPQQLEGLPLLHIVAPEDRAEVEALVASRVETSMEMRARRTDGTLFESTLTVANLAERTRVVLVHDRSDRARAERAKDEFISVVSHELRTPLASIQGALGLIEGGAVGEVSSQANDLVSIAKRNAERLIRLVNDILDLKKLESGRMRLRCKAVDPAISVATTVEGLRVLAQDASVELAVEVQQGPPAWADPDRVIQVLTNLVSNAIKFAPAGSVVTIGAAPRSESVRFWVVDHGPGIPEDERERMFSRFQQLDASDTRAKGGTGLGLSIARAIVAAHEGVIGVDSAPDEGSTFYFELPIAKDQGTSEISAPVLHASSADDL